MQQLPPQIYENYAPQLLQQSYLPPISEQVIPELQYRILPAQQLTPTVPGQSSNTILPSKKQRLNFAVCDNFFELKRQVRYDALDFH